MRPSSAHHSSSPPGLTRWSMLTAVLETYRQIRLSFPSAWIAGSSPAMTKEKGTTKEKRKRNADRRVHPTSAPLSPFPLPRAGEGREGARRALKRSALAYRRSTTALTVRAFGPWAQLQARLPGTWQDVRSCTAASTGRQRPRVLTRALCSCSTIKQCGESTNFTLVVRRSSAR